MERARLIALLRETGCAEQHGECVFLVDPHWSTGEQAQAAEIFQRVALNDRIDRGIVGIRTGGSSGGIKFARHDERTFMPAVRGFCAHFGLSRVNAVDVLPPWHISGLMSRVRCVATGGRHLAWDWKRLDGGEFPELRPSPEPWMISLVPTQLQRLLGSAAAVDWLRRFAIIFLGGGPTWPELADAAAAERLCLSLSYGMTETAAMVAALRPEEFLAGARSCGRPLPHAAIRMSDAGTLAIRGESVCHGYFDTGDGRAGGEFSAHGVEREFVTEDLGAIDERGHVHLHGRRDAVIITGGKKVQPLEVEAALRASGEFIDVAVVGVPHPEWGEQVVACYLATERAPDLTRAAARLAPHQRPKRFIPIADWPRNAQGKLNRAKLFQLIAAKT